MLAQCDALLKRHIPGFELDNLEDIIAREGIDVTNPADPNSNFQFHSSRNFRSPESLPPQPGSPLKGYPIYPGPHMMPPPGYGPHSMIPYGGPSPYSQIPPMAGGPPGPYPNIHPAFQHHPPGPPYAPPPELPHDAQSPPRSLANDIKGQDPKSNDMSNTQVTSCPNSYKLSF